MAIVKTNFKIKKRNSHLKSKTNETKENNDLSQAEFEDFIVKAGAAGSFMVFRSNKKTDELGVDQL